MRQEWPICHQPHNNAMRISTLGPLLHILNRKGKFVNNKMASAFVCGSPSSSPTVFFLRNTNTPKQSSLRYSLAAKARAESMATEKLGIKVEKNPDESKLSQLGVRQWPKWGCPRSKFPWTYSAKETCYLLEGKVKVYPDGSNDFVEIGAGDLVEFPKGMSCTWEVSVAVDKHYKFD